MKLLNQELQIKNLYIKQDSKTGLIGLIAIHNTKNGPALGGCRFVTYHSVDEAITDVMKLAKAMTYKSAMAGLPLGGGKSVIISHPGIKNRENLLESFGEFVETLNGRYITASDSGTSEEDMKIVARKTKHVTSINQGNEPTGDTTFMTATGVVHAIQAAIAEKFKQDNLSGVHVAIQGIGSVGFLLAKMLLDKGARISITDINTELLTQRASELNVEVLSPTEILKVKCEVFAPCALGGVITETVLDNLQTRIVCGAANNQLQNNELAAMAHRKDILLVPDYVANAGGVICAAAQAGVITVQDSIHKVKQIFDSILNILTISKDTNVPPNLIANQLAEERFS